MEEANKMRKYSHPHLLSLEGISKIQGKYVTVSQLMTNGGLRQYLLKQADQVTIFPYDETFAGLANVCDLILGTLRGIMCLKLFLALSYPVPCI